MTSVASATSSGDAAAVTTLELQIEAADADVIDLMTANDAAKCACHTLVRSLNGVGGVARLVHGCHDMALAMQNFEAELAALEGEERRLLEGNAQLRQELECAVKCMETLVYDAAELPAAAATLGRQGPLSPIARSTSVNSSVASVARR